MCWCCCRVLTPRREWCCTWSAWCGSAWFRGPPERCRSVPIDAFTRTPFQPNRNRGRFFVAGCGAENAFGRKPICGRGFVAARRVTRSGNVNGSGRRTGGDSAGGRRQLRSCRVHLFCRLARVHGGEFGGGAKQRSKNNRFVRGAGGKRRDGGVVSQTGLAAGTRV